MAWSQEIAVTQPWNDLGLWTIKGLLRPVQLLISAPCFLFLAALTAMLLRHPDVRFFEIDRVAFAVLVVAVVLRALVWREEFFHLERATFPMLALTALAVVSVLGQPFEPEAWSLMASKFIVPFSLFHIAGIVFTRESDFRKFETFAVVVLAYLSFTAIAFFAGLQVLIFPKFILDESLGFHADRARGPLLQAVANGVSLNMLGLIAFHAYERATVKPKKFVLLLASLPLAILATMTRAVWLAFAGSALVVLLRSRSRQLKRAWVWLIAIAAVGCAVLFSSQNLTRDVSERLEERGPIDYRQAVYSGGWEMFQQRPWMGWGFHQMPPELPRHVSGYKLKVLYPHNTYLELLVEHGLLGLGLYLWLIWELWRLGRWKGAKAEGFLNQNFLRLWPVILCVYWVNAAVVVMSYQFVNGLLFTVAGMLAGQRRRMERTAW